MDEIQRNNTIDVLQNELDYWVEKNKREKELSDLKDDYERKFGDKGPLIYRYSDRIGNTIKILELSCKISNIKHGGNGKIFEKGRMFEND